MSISPPPEAPQRTDTLTRHPYPEPLQLNLGVALIVFLTYFFTTSRLDENFQMLGIVALFTGIVFFDRFASSWWTWATVSFCLLAGIVMRPIDVPNHHYMLFYAGLALTLCLTADPARRLELMRINFRWIIVALMGIATVQRLVQPTFMTGDYLGLETALGGFAHPLLKLFPEHLAIANANKELVETLRNAPPGQLDAVTLTSPFPALPFIAKSFMIVILVIEAWVCLLMWRLPKHWLTHLSIMAFGASLAVLRQELTFISVLCLLGLLSCPVDKKWIRLAYTMVAILVAASVVKTIIMPGPMQ
ncbi:MAG: hypothetical protein AAF733_11260 [Verrucomicrobiota bacterium]